MMDSEDIVDDVNALLKLDVGDPYRLEHIKQAYIQNKTVWKTDGDYLQRMKEKYLVKHDSYIQSDVDENVDDGFMNKDVIHCWKCGKKSQLGANFCMSCGSSLFDVDTNNQTTHQEIPHTKQLKTTGLKIPLIIGIPILVLLVIGGAYSQGFFDNAFEKYVSDDSVDNTVDSKLDVGDSGDAVIVPAQSNSKCGAGTIFDSKTNSCILDK